MDMRKQFLSIALSFALIIIPCCGQSVETQLRAFSPDTPIELRLTDGSKLRGWISELSSTGFTLTQERKNRLEKRQIEFKQAQSVKQVKSVRPSHTTRNILIGVGIGIAGVAILLITMAKVGGYL